MVPQVNVSPGFGGLPHATKVNAAEAILVSVFAEASSSGETSMSRRYLSRDMPEDMIPGSRVRATTKHGTLTADEIASMLPGMSRLMDELAHRYWVLYYAAKGGNWELAGYMERESEKLLETIALARPKYKDDLAIFVAEHFERIARAIDARDWRAFDSAYRAAIQASDVYHEKYKKGFIRFRLPDRPPEWFDLGPQ